MDIKSKFLGSIIGSALGDSIGELAFNYHEKEELIKEINNRKAIRYTDDTAMVIGIAETIISNKGDWATEDLGAQFHQNYKREPYRGYGLGPPMIFRTVEREHKKYQEVAEGLFGGDGSYGNGASMRIAPLGVFYYESKNIYEIAKRAAVATHTHPLGIDGAAILAKLISILIPKDPDKFDIKQHEIEILTEIIEFAKTDEYKSKLSKIKDLLEKNADIIDAEKIVGSNVLAFTSVPFSIFAFFRNPYSFKDALLDTVLVSRDRDTVGAMMSGLLGSFLGINKIPKNWINKLENMEYIRQLATSLYEIKKREL